MLMGVLLSPCAFTRLSRSVKQKGTCTPLQEPHSCSSWLFPPKMPRWTLAADSFAHFSVPGPQLAAYPASCYATLGLLRDRSTADIKSPRSTVSRLISRQLIRVSKHLPIRLVHSCRPLSPLLKQCWVALQL